MSLAIDVKIKISFYLELQIAEFYFQKFFYYTRNKSKLLWSTNEQFFPTDQWNNKRTYGAGKRFNVPFEITNRVISIYVGENFISNIFNH